MLGEGGFRKPEFVWQGGKGFMETYYLWWWGRERSQADKYFALKGKELLWGEMTEVATLAVA